jgi:hypothetical protein
MGKWYISFTKLNATYKFALILDWEIVSARLVGCKSCYIGLNNMVFEMFLTQHCKLHEKMNRKMMCWF